MTASGLRAMVRREGSSQRNLGRVAEKAEAFPEGGTDGMVADIIAEYMKLIQPARLLVGRTQAQLAKEAGVTTEALSKAEKQDKSVSAEQLSRILGALAKAGIVFVARTEGHSIGVALSNAGG